MIENVEMIFLYLSYDIKMNNKDYFCITFVCVGVEFLDFNVLLHNKSEQKVIDNWFCTPMIFKNPKKRFFNKKYAYYNIHVGGV